MLLVSIHDVPLYERHLLFCSKLDHGRRPHRHGHGDHNLPTLGASLAVGHGRVAAANRVPLGIGCNF